MSSTTKTPILGTLLAIAVTTAMDATGYSVFSALPLFPLAGLFWLWQRFSRVDMGLRWGRLSSHALALLYPFTVLAGVALIALLAGAVDISEADWGKAGLNALLMSTTGILMVLITEEGFFRGWLWASLARAGRGDRQILVWTTLAFTLWHVSAISLDTGFDVPARQIPVYLVNATLIGAVFGMLRLLSGSLVVASVCHAVWNGIAYPLFGFGTRVGALGIERTDLFGPEVGLAGLGLNLLFAAALWSWMRRRGRL